MRFPGFIGPSYTNARSKNIDCQRCVNLYPEKHELGNGKEAEVAALLRTPGLRRVVTLATSPVRGVYTASNGRVFAVGGTKFYEITLSGSTYSATERGTIVSTTGTVSMKDNGIDVFLVDGTSAGYSFTLGSNTFAAISDGDFLGADVVDYQDGYFLFNKRNSGQWYISGLNAITFDALDITTSEGDPDNVVAVRSFRGLVWALNQRSTEVYQNTGNADFPFERMSGGRIPVGLAAKHSVGMSEDAMFFLGRDALGAGIVYGVSNFSPQRISTHPVEQAIQGYSDISDAEGFCYQQEGHLFYVLNFPTADSTWVFDVTTGLWHERAYQVDGQFERHRANYHTYGLDTHIVGDYKNKKLYAFETDYYSDDGQEIIWERTAPHVSSDMKRVCYKEFVLDVELGVGLDGASTTQGHDPQVMMQFSDDGGHTWSNEKWRSIGKIGVRHKRAKWERLGMSRDRVFRVRGSDPVKYVLIGASIELEGMAS